MPRHYSTAIRGKSPAQLNREIAETLTTRPRTTCYACDDEASGVRDRRPEGGQAREQSPREEEKARSSRVKAAPENSRHRLLERLPWLCTLGASRGDPKVQPPRLKVQPPGICSSQKRQQKDTTNE